MSQVRFDPETMIPEVVKRYPSTRAVFDRYGLKGCGGPSGPPETLAFFARAHAVELERLIAEITEIALAEEEGTAAAEYRYEESPADLIYKRFFKGGIVVSLTVGCLFGAFMLLYYAGHRSFFSVPINLIHMHGHAQIFGWIGLIAMGFSYQAYPRFKHTVLAHPRLASLSFIFMVAGIAIRSVSQALLPGPTSIPPGVAAGVLEWMAASFFVVVMVRTLRQSDIGTEPFDKFVVTAIAAFWLAALLNPVVFAYFASATGPQVLIERIATWSIPYRDLQILAFATMLIYGVSLRYVPAVLGFREAGRRASTGIYVVFSTAIAADIVFFLLLRRSHAPVWGMGLEASYVLMLLSAFLMVRQLGILHPPAETDRSVKFVQAAYIWLIIAFGMLAFMPAYNRLTGQSFSHAYFGAYRHAITVGFISMMILGVSSKVIPFLAGQDTKGLNPLNHAFYLLNIGNALRVGCQVATDHVEWAYSVMGVSGFIEVTAILLWGVDIWRSIGYRQPYSPSTAAFEITSKSRVAEVIDRYPETLEVFLGHGFDDLRNPVLRRTVARAATIERACGIHRVDVDEFIAALKERAGE
jgi:hypothetical protein